MKRMMEKSLFGCGAVCIALLLTLAILKTSSATTCGHPVIRQRVVGGRNSTIGKYPWMGSLVHKGGHICGASLISPNWAVTAAHCVLDKNAVDLTLVFGILTLEGYTDSRVIVNVELIIKHPLYLKDGNSGDLAALKMKISVPYSNYILPICLPEPGQNFPNGKMCVLTGWGYTAEEVRLPEPYVLQEAGLPMVNYTVCEAVYKAKFPTTYPDGLIKSDMFCAGFPDGSRDGCQGDSGGPFACYVNDHWLLVGIVSWGIGCGTPGAPGVYTKISNFTNWIIKNTDLKDTQPSETEFSTKAKVTNSTTSQPPAVNTTVTTLTTLTTSTSPKPVTTTTTVYIQKVTTAKPKNAAQSSDLTNGSWNTTQAFLQDGDPTDCGHSSSSPMCLLAVGLILTKMWSFFH